MGIFNRSTDTGTDRTDAQPTPTDPPCLGCGDGGKLTDEQAANWYDWMQALRDAGIHGAQRGEGGFEV